jgi:hypothetical protein
MSTYTATVRWSRSDGGDFTNGQYSRAHEWAVVIRMIMSL